MCRYLTAFHFHTTLTGFDHGVGHPLLFLYNAKAPNYRKNKVFKGLGHYSEWPKVADAVIKATLDFLFLHDVWTTFGRLICHKITSTISTAWNFTTKSGGIWEILPLVGLRNHRVEAHPQHRRLGLVPPLVVHQT